MTWRWHGYSHLARPRPLRALRTDWTPGLCSDPGCVAGPAIDHVGPRAPHLRCRAPWPAPLRGPSSRLLLCGRSSPSTHCLLHFRYFPGASASDAQGTRRRTPLGTQQHRAAASLRRMQAANKLLWFYFNPLRACYRDPATRRGPVSPPAQTRRRGTHSISESNLVPRLAGRRENRNARRFAVCNAKAGSLSR